MNDDQWRTLFIIANQTLGQGTPSIETSLSWCSWTTYDRLTRNDAGYWQSGIPWLEDIKESCIGDGGVWGQPFHYADIAHIIFPAEFCTSAGELKAQSIGALSAELSSRQIEHQHPGNWLEIKLY